MLGNYLVAMANDSKYEVRIANSWNAYQWISNDTTQKITKTMQNRVIEEKVDDLLRLALLMENGGVFIKLTEVLLVENFNWVESYLTEK